MSWELVFIPPPGVQSGPWRVLVLKDKGPDESCCFSHSVDAVGICRSWWCVWVSASVGEALRVPGSGALPTPQLPWVVLALRPDSSCSRRGCLLPSLVLLSVATQQCKGLQSYGCHSVFVSMCPVLYVFQSVSEFWCPIKSCMMLCHQKKPS